MVGTLGIGEIWQSCHKSIRSRIETTRGFALISALWGDRGGRVPAGAKASRHTEASAIIEDTAYQTQKMEALGRLTGGVAHDFNNLLTVVLGNATALRAQAESRGDAQAMRRAEMIERAAERGGRLAGQLLAFSRKQVLRPEVVSVYRVISATHELLAQAAGEAARVLLHTEPNLWNCLVDPGQLESAILNLVLNARDAMPVGGNIVITFRNTKFRRTLNGALQHAPGDYVSIEVKDPGSGIPLELHEKVFEPFFTTKPVGQGSGLGLSQVHGFAGQSGGWVQLESAPAQGTTVTLFLPRAKGRDSAPSPLPDGAAPVGHNETILVVEPDSDLRMSVCDTLIRCGYDAIRVATGSGALAILGSNERVHVLVIAARLPGGVSGVVLARSACQIRSDLGVVITCGASSDMPEEGGSGRFEFIMKPFRPLDLARVVGAVLTSDSFSAETEKLLAEVRNIASRPEAFQGTTRPAEPPSGLRGNGIRLGVMPFRTIGAASDAAFSTGLAEEITSAFSRFRWITCVAPASVAALADEPAGQTDRWRQLDLDYLIEGSFRKKGNEIRVLLRLVTMRGVGEITWGQRFDGLLPNVLNLQDQIASATAARIAPELLVWEGDAATERPQVNPTAYDLMLRAIPAIYRLDEAGFRAAGPLLEQSLALDPSSAACHSWLAHWYLFLFGQGWAPNEELAIRRATDLAQQAVALDPEDARGFAVAGHVRAFLNKDAEAALCLHERAISLNPNLALAWCYSGLAHTYLGEHTEAIRRFQHAQDLSPYDPHGFFFDMAMSMPLLLTGQFKEAARISGRARDRNARLSSTYKVLLPALGHLGAKQEAAAVRKVLFELEPHFSIDEALSRSAFQRPEDRACYAEGLRRAGIPEHRKGPGVPRAISA
jgi:signal transduction histidine kinase/TolB-like protein